MTTIYVKQDSNLPDRAKNDRYVTEMNLIRAAFDHIPPFNPYAASILDIGAGDGRWGHIAAQYLKTYSVYDPYPVVGVEIEDIPQPAFGYSFTDWFYKTDFLKWESPFQTYDVIVSNPPYYIAEDVIKKAWDLLAPEGCMIMLLRLAFQAGINRYYNLFDRMPPKKVFVCSRRPSFYGGGTNGTDYGVYYWEKQPNWVDTRRTWETQLLMYERGDE